MIQRQLVSSHTQWEATVGYSRAIRTGPLIEVAGTTAVDDNGQVIGQGDAYTQATFIFQKIGNALAALGAGFEHVIRTRMYVAHIDDWPAVGRAHGAIFGDIRPASTLIGVDWLVDPALLVEIEVTAWHPTMDSL